jgi:hypothetical protein
VSAARVGGGSIFDSRLRADTGAALADAGIEQVG